MEAARLITENGLRDFHQAKLKAAERLGLFDDAALPANSEIEEALREHQRLFAGEAHADTLKALRETAREALRFFSRFEPRLVGAVLEGTADEHSAVCLHLYTDLPTAVEAHLLEHGIPFERQTRRLRLDRKTQSEFPVLLFSADDAAIDITVLPYDLLRQAPLDRFGDKPMQRASIGSLDALLSVA